MNITELSLYGFRNFSDVDEVALPADSLLVAAAPNATGKTNFLESLVMLLRGRSFRASHADCIGWERDSFIIRGQIARNDGTSSLAVRYHAPTRRLRVEENGVPASPVTFFGRYPLVLFLPEDTFLFVRSPAQRRNALNRVLVSNPAYVSALVQYQRALRQRNALLKQAESYADVAAWTDLLVQYAVQLWQQREQLAVFLQTHLSAAYERISGEERSLQVKLVPGVDDVERFSELLENSFAQEQRYKYTLLGPHRDDLLVTTEGKELPKTLSQGQMRSVVIAFTFVVHQFIESTLGERPLLLLDEVLSELDDKRQETLLANIPKGQVLLTCTSVPESLRKVPNVHLLDLRSIIAESKEKEVEQTDAVAVSEPSAVS